MTKPRRIILQQEEAVEEELALVNQGTLNIDQNLVKIYRLKKRKAETSGSSPLNKSFGGSSSNYREAQSTEEQIEIHQTGRYEIGFIGSVKPIKLNHTAELLEDKLTNFFF